MNLQRRKTPYAALVLLLGFVGCSGNPSTTSGTHNPSPMTTKTPTPATQASGNVAGAGDDHNAIQISAIALGKQLKTDAAATEKKYAGKTLIVDGTVGVIFHDIAGLETGEKGVSVQFFLPKSTPATAKVESGYAVKVRGEASFGAAGVLNLVDCTILESKLAQTPPIPAGKLTEEFVKDKDATDGKYFLKTIVIEGVVAKVVFQPKDKERYILLAGHNEKDAKPSSGVARTLQGDHEEPAFPQQLSGPVKLQAIIPRVKRDGLVMLSDLTGRCRRRWSRRDCGR
jgi:tRNA_anti-like